MKIIIGIILAVILLYGCISVILDAEISTKIKDIIIILVSAVLFCAIIFEED